MPVRWQGPKASYHGNLDKPVVTCEVNKDRPASMPTGADDAKSHRPAQSQRQRLLPAGGGCVD